ncbi:MAG: hypothetical protein IH609_07780 [Dehalococcoidia bacterium]|nr:hypothetical protein [Dehalococcoidia bacterium]
MAGELPFPEHPVGTCINCGFLGKSIVLVKGTKFEPVPADERGHANNFNQTFIAPGSTGPAAPACWLGAVSFRREIADAIDLSQPLEERERAALGVYTKDRRCEQFHPLRPYLSPTEHWQERETMRLEEQRRGWQGDLESDRRAFWREYDERKGKWQSRWNWRFVLLAAAQIAVGLIALGIALMPTFEADEPKAVVVFTPTPTSTHTPTPIPHTATPQPEPTEQASPR